MEISYRRAVMDDAPELQRIQREAYLPLYAKYRDEESPANDTIEEFEKKILNPYASYYVIETGGIAVGGIFAHPFDPETLSNEAMYLCGLFVAPKMQGMSIAQRAIRFIEKQYSETKEWFLDVPASEEKNIHLYEKMGYKATGYCEKINDSLTLAAYAKLVK